MANNELSHDNLQFEHGLIPLEAPETPYWYNEPGVSDAHTPWQHTPLSPFDKSVRHYQQQVREAMTLLVQNPPEAYSGKDLEDLVMIDFETGMANRELRSSTNFALWRDQHSHELDNILTSTAPGADDVRWELGQAVSGHGTARGQIDLFMHARSLNSIGLQVLSTPFGYRSQFLPSMVSEIEAAVHDVGGRWLGYRGADDMISFKIAADPTRELGKNQPCKAILATFKWKMAELSELAASDATQPPAWDISVVGRQSWMVLTDEQSGFSENYAKLFQYAPNWQENLSPEGLDEVRHYLLDRIESGQSSVILSMSTYAHRPKTS